MSSPPANFNYAHAAGIESVAAAIVFAVIYVPLFGLSILRLTRHPGQVFIMLSFFTIIRAVAFITRAVLAGIHSAGESRNFVIANQIIYGIGFLGLLWSAYNLVLDRDLVSDGEKPKGGLRALVRNRHLYRIALSAAVILGIVGTVELSSANATQSDITLGSNLRKASVVIFVVLVALLAFLTATYIINEAKNDHVYRQGNDSIGLVHGAKILGLIAVLLLAREVFMLATINDLAKEEREVFWYPLAATTELLVVCLFLTPDLVPATVSQVNNRIPMYTAEAPFR